MTKPKRILVTGGAGFIGSNIVDGLLQQGHQVVVVDNLSTGRRENVNPAATFYPVNICHPELKTVFEKETPDLVNHQAAQTVIQRSVADPVFDAEQNIIGSLNLLQQCRRFGVKKIIYASSGGAVYGEPDHRPVDENHRVNPVSYYGVSKYAVEHYLRLYALEPGFDYTVLRYANVYGSRQNPKGEAGVVAIFAGLMLAGKQPTIFGKGDKTRDYVHVSDVVAANLLAMEKGKNSIYNIGTGVETTDQEIFDALAQLTGYKDKPIYAPARKGEVFRICLDVSKAKKELGWRPRLSIREGLQQAAGYYRSLSQS